MSCVQSWRLGEAKDRGVWDRTDLTPSDGNRAIGSVRVHVVQLRVHLVVVLILEAHVGKSLVLGHLLLA